MKGIKLKALSAGRKGVLAGAAVAVVGLSLLGSASIAHAAVGTSIGTLTLSAPTGSLTSAPTWSQTAACPGTANGSAKLEIVLSDGVSEQAWSANINGAASALSGEALEKGATIGALESVAGYSAGQTAELVVNCYSGASGTGTLVPFNDGFITFNTDGATYSFTDSQPSGPATPTVTLSATPNPVQEGSTVTLTATVAVSGAPVTTGAVEFESNGSEIGSAAVAVNSSGVASTPTTFTAAGSLSLTAVYQTADSTTFNNATSNTVTENVTTTNPNSVGELITVSVAPTGSFTFTGTTNATAALTQNGNTTAGTLVPVTVTDTRTGLAANASVPSLVNGFNGYPGWSVVGQATDFTDPTSQPAGDIPVANFNWTPTTPAAADFTLGNASTAGLGTAQTLAAAATGHGNGAFTLGANLDLTIPTSAPAGAYSSTLTLTANPTANFS